MNSFKRFGWLSAVAFVATFAGAEAYSQVTGTVYDGHMRSGKTGFTPMMIVSVDTVDGLNGEMNFDSALFSNPRVQLGTNSQGFTALGNEVSAGVFRFILYKNPADTPLEQGKPILRFLLDVVPNLVNSTVSTVTFTAAGDAKSAAARIVTGGTTDEVVSIDNVVFESFDIFVNGASARNWHFYE